jgi:hypothetical protein
MSTLGIPETTMSLIASFSRAEWSAAGSLKK